VAPCLESQAVRILGPFKGALNIGRIDISDPIGDQEK
jgi:hypothetical protein